MPVALAKSDSESDMEIEASDARQEELDPIGDPFAHIKVSDDIPSLEDTQYVSLEAEDLVGTLGVSGLCVLATTKEDYVQLFSIALQSVIMQTSILGFLVSEIKKNPLEPQQRDGSFEFLTIIAIWLHFLNTFSALPYQIAVAMNFKKFQDTTLEWLGLTPLFLWDNGIMPILTFVIGAYFIIALSKGPLDVMMNSCAVAFIGNIDNWILTLNMDMQRTASFKTGTTVYLPYQKGFITVLEYLVCVFPVIPGGISWALYKSAQAFLGHVEDCEKIDKYDCPGKGWFPIDVPWA